MVLLLDTEQLPPRPKPIGYIPVENIDTLLKTIALAGVTSQKVTGQERAWELTPSNGDPLTVRVKNGYAYFTDSRLELNETLPDIASLVGPLAARYDASVSIRVNAVPMGIRQVFVAFLRASAETELQRHDDEPEAAYLVRRANGVSGLEFIEQLLTQGEDITIGWDASPEKKTATFEVSINATPDSEFAKYLHDSAGRPSMFAALRNDDKPLCMSLSWMMNQRERTAATGWAQAAKSQMSLEFPAAALPDGPLDNFFKSIQATIDDGQIDMFFQFAANDPEKFVFLGGVKMVGGENFGLALGQMLNHLILKIADGENTEEAPQILPQSEEHEGVVIHKMISQEYAARRETHLWRRSRYLSRHQQSGGLVCGRRGWSLAGPQAGDRRRPSGPFATGTGRRQHPVSVDGPRRSLDRTARSPRPRSRIPKMMKTAFADENVTPSARRPDENWRRKHSPRPMPCASKRPRPIPACEFGSASMKGS